MLVVAEAERKLQDKAQHLVVMEVVELEQLQVQT
jgi:hypothetical protein